MRAFYALCAVQVLSYIGSTMTSIAFGIWVFQQTGDAAPVLLTALFSSLPQMIGGAFTGALIDRWDKRHVLIMADVGQAVGTVLLIFSVVSGRFEIWHLYAVALWQGLFGMLQAPTMMAFITTLVPPERLERANAIQQTTGRIAGVIAPAITGVAYGLIHLQGILLIDFVTFACAVGVTARLAGLYPSEEKVEQKKRVSIWAETRDGIQYLWSQGALFWLIVHGTIINFFLSSVLSLSTPYVLTVTHSEGVLGLVLGVLNVGPIVGAVVIAWWGGTRSCIHTIMPAILCIGVAVIAYGVAQSPAVLIVSAFFILLPMPMVTSLIPAIIQFKTPQQLQGRVFAVVFQLASLANPLSLILTAWLVDHVLVGMRLVIAGAGAAIFLITVLFYALPTIRNVEKS